MSRAALLSVFLMASYAAGAADVMPAYLGRHETNEADRQAIEHVLETYTQSVNTGDRARFESILLDPDIPFSSADAATRPDDKGLLSTRHYADFKAAVFDSGERFDQRFYNVRIEQDGDLAQVALDFVTLRKGSGRGGHGWKVLHLLKVRGDWKIASEFYTARAIPGQD